MKGFCTAVVLAAAAGALVLAQAKNPLIGRWKLNVDKSKAPFKSGTTVIEAAGKDGVKFTVDLVGTDGTAHGWEFTAQFDGKEYPVTGWSPYGDRTALTRVDARTTRIRSTYQGKPTTYQTIVVSADGMTRTTTTKGTDKNGQPLNSISIYEKQ
jgi:hypothetical protein